MKLERCDSCGGFVVTSTCPHCGQKKKRTRALGALGATLGGGAIAFTLMACYGGPPACPDGTNQCWKTPATADDGGLLKAAPPTTDAGAAPTP